MGTRNRSSEGFGKKLSTLPAVLAFLGVTGYGDIVGSINSHLKTKAKQEANELITNTKSRLIKALGNFSQRNNPGISKAKGNTIDTFELEGKKCDLVINDDGVFFIFVEGIKSAFYIGDEDKAKNVISTLKNLFGTRSDTKTILASK